MNLFLADSLLTSLFNASSFFPFAQFGHIPAFCMGFKVNDDGSYAVFRGWTIICPVKIPNSPIGAEVDAINREWSKTLTEALDQINSAPNGAHFACLPAKSLHMTITGLSEEKTGRVPANLIVRFFF